MLLNIIKEAFVASFWTILTLTLIILPLMVFFEYLSHYNLTDKIPAFFYRFLKLLSLPREAAFPLMIGLLIGLFYGAAIIMEYARQGILTKRDLMLLGVFLSINHSIIEDNLIFAALGANLPVLLVIRFIMAFLVTKGVAVIFDYEVQRAALKEPM